MPTGRAKEGGGRRIRPLISAAFDAACVEACFVEAVVRFVAWMVKVDTLVAGWIVKAVA